jgi:hypothetical protein
MPAGLADPSARPSRENGESVFQADHIQHVAAQRLQHDRALERGGDVRVFLGGDVQVSEQRGRGYRQRAAGQIVDDRPQHDQTYHPPT